MENPITLTRFDKNIAHNMGDFRIYGKDEELITKLVVFFSHDFQYNLLNHTIWGTRILIVQDLAPLIGYESKSLTNPHPDPAQFREPKFAEMSKEELQQLKKMAKEGKVAPLFDTVLDNALYHCRYTSMRLTKAGKTFDGTQSSKLEEIKFLKSVKKFYHPVKDRIYYEIEYDKTMLNNLARFYLKFDFNIFSSLSAPSVQKFYISLIDLRDRYNVENQNKVRLTIEFDKLCQLARTNCKSPSERKRAINNSIEAVNEYHGSEFVKITWLNNGKFNFMAQLDFTMTEKEILFAVNDARQKFDHFLLHNMKEAFQNSFPMVKDETEYKKLFTKFLKDVDWLFEVKHAQVLKTWAQCVGKEVDDPWSTKILAYIKEELPKMAEKPLWPQNEIQKAVG